MSQLVLSLLLVGTAKLYPFADDDGAVTSGVSDADWFAWREWVSVGSVGRCNAGM